VGVAGRIACEARTDLPGAPPHAAPSEHSRTPIVSLFDASSKKVEYTIVGASAATALPLAMKLELRAFAHEKAARDYLLLAFDAQHGQEDLRNRIAQLLREAPVLPACLCTTVVDAGNRDGGAASNRDV